MLSFRNIKEVLGSITFALTFSAIYFAVGTFLIFKSDKISELLNPKEFIKEILMPDKKELLILAFYIIGILTAINGITILVSGVSGLLFAGQIKYRLGDYSQNIITSVVKIAIAYFLIYKNKQLIKLLKIENKDLEK